MKSRSSGGSRTSTAAPQPSSQGVIYGAHVRAAQLRNPRRGQTVRVLEQEIGDVEQARGAVALGEGWGHGQ
jgi:hypothetical protein